MSPASVRAVLLDAAGTLVDIEPPAPRLRALLAERFGVSVSVEQARIAIHAEIMYYRSHMQDGADAQRLAELRRRCAGVLLAALPPSAELASLRLDEITELLLDSLVFRAFPEAAEALSRLRAQGLRLVVASNWDCSLESVLERIDLRGLVDGVAVSAEVGATKPDPQLLREALRLADARPEEALHVGDSLAEDVGAALAAGVRPVFLSRHGAPGPPGVTVIASLAELANVLDLPTRT